jgi:hypothetical protein
MHGPSASLLMGQSAAKIGGGATVEFRTASAAHDALDVMVPIVYEVQQIMTQP